jgi:hypothetical protein
MTARHRLRQGPEDRNQPVQARLGQDLADRRPSRGDPQLPPPASVNLSPIIRAPMACQSQSCWADRSATITEWSRVTDARAAQNCCAFPASTCASGVTTASPSSDQTRTLFPRGLSVNVSRFPPGKLGLPLSLAPRERTRPEEWRLCRQPRAR